MTNIPAYVALTPTGPLVPGKIRRREVGPNDVRIKIRWAGICHSDIHTVKGDWGPQHYPLTVGHEIAGYVAEVGSAVKKFRVDEKVGVGCLVNSCKECANCRAGLEQYCTNGAVGTYGSLDRDGTITQGGYSTEIVVNEDFVLHVPDSLPFERVAPLLCAGITTYSPLKHWAAGPGVRVAVVGLGGLGHMAVQIANALGAEVTVLSQSLRKKDDGLKLGASAYYATSDPATFTDLKESFDLIINTVSAPIDLDAFLRLLAVNGTLVSVGAPAEPMSLRVGSLEAMRRSYAGSSIGGIAETQEMLDFCAQAGIAPIVEIIAADRVNEAWERVLASDVRFRFVIDIDSLKK